LSILPVFETFQSHHDRQGFDCGKPPLNDFLQRQARQNADRNVGITHVAVKKPADSKILAYYTLVTRIVDAAIIPNKKLPKGEIGVVLLGRLAVDKSQHRKGLGRMCLTRAMLQVEQSAREIGIYALVLDALDEEARAWYLGLDMGFDTLLDSPTHLYLPVDTIRTIMDEPFDLPS
jgi:GNAT superfamily N-acetyltransferase